MVRLLPPIDFMENLQGQNGMLNWSMSSSFSNDASVANRCYIAIETTAGERKTAFVAILTVAMMIAEIAAGWLSGSMALLADGLHMGSHAVALGISYVAYVYARKNAANPLFTFGTGKVNALGGYTGAILLVVFACWMSWDSVERILHPVSIDYTHALWVAAVGLLVNVVSALVLQHDSHHHHHHDDSHAHPHSHDHNLQAAYLHVLADAATSVTAIAALLAARYLNAPWLDPMMGCGGSVLVISWSAGLLRKSSGVLLDHDGPSEIRKSIETSFAGLNVHVVDWHLWALAPGRFAAILSLVSDDPRTAAFYKAHLPPLPQLVHFTIEVNAKSDQQSAEPVGL